MRKNYILKTVLSAIVILLSGSFTQLSAQYCTSGANYTGDTEIDEVVLAGASLTINNNTASTCATYTDNTGTDTADFILGGTYSISVTTGKCGFSYYGRIHKVYIDWNQDFDFDDAGEEVAVSPYFGYGGTPTAVVSSITVPATALPGYTRMRVVAEETSSPSGVLPCGSYAWGETEDYTLQVKGYANDIGIAAMTNPTFPTCAMDSVVKVSIMNSGNLALTSATINWSVNGTLQPSYAYSGSLASFGMDTLTMGTVAGGLNDGDVVNIWASMANGLSPDSNTANDSISNTLYNSLSGTYVIDPSGAGDFISFTEAVNAMNDFGICAATVFEVVDGTYVEQFELAAYTGMSSMNNVTFRSQSGEADSVIVTYISGSTSDNYVVRLFEAPYFSFEDLTFWNQGTSYAYCAHIWGSDSVSFDGCKFNTVNNAYAYNAQGINAYSYNNGTYLSSDYLTITNCEFDGGYFNLYYYNYSSAGDYGDNAVIENNKFMNAYYYGAYVYYATDLQFNNNYAAGTNINSYGYAMYISYATNGSIANNFVEGNATWPRVGLYINNCQGDLTTFMPITNNRVYLPNSAADYGIYAYNCLFTDFSHNSVYTLGDASCRTFYFYNGSYNKVKNNNIQTGGAGQAFYYQGIGIYQMDYNNLSAPNGNVGYSGGNQATLADWQAASGFDANSITVNDVYSDTARLKVCNDSLYAMGESLGMYPMDYEGDMRQTPPCIGADEFLPISQFGINDNPVLCDGDTLVLRQDYYDLVVWNTIDTSNVYTVSAPGSQSVAVYDECGSDTSNFTVTPQDYAFVADTNLCEGTSAALSTGISGGTYMWSTGSTDSTITVSSAQTVTVMVVGPSGCTSADTSVVTQSMDVMLADSTTFCEGANAVLDANMTGTYLWSDGSTNQTLSVTTPGTYSVTVTDQNCISSAASNVTEILNVVPSFTDSSSYFTVAFTNTTQNATSYLWDFGDGTTSTDVNPIHIYPYLTQDSVNYVVTLTAYNSCGDNEFINEAVRAGQAVSVSEVGIESMVNVYPNPNNGLFNVVVTTDAAKEMSVEVVDVRGSLIYNQSFGTVNGEVNRAINIEGSAQGIYFVKVTLNNETAVYRLSVE